MEFYCDATSGHNLTYKSGWHSWRRSATQSNTIVSHITFYNLWIMIPNPSFFENLFTWMQPNTFFYLKLTFHNFNLGAPQIEIINALRNITLGHFIIANSLINIITGLSPSPTFEGSFSYHTIIIMNFRLIVSKLYLYNASRNLLKMKWVSSTTLLRIQVVLYLYS